MNISDYFTIDNIPPGAPAWYVADPEQTECYTLVHNSSVPLYEADEESSYELLAFPPNCTRVAPACVQCGAISFMSQLEVAVQYGRFRMNELVLRSLQKRLELKKQEIANSFIKLLCERYCTRKEDIINYKDSLVLAVRNTFSTEPRLDPALRRYIFFATCDLYLFNLKAFPPTAPLFFTIPTEIELE